MKRKAFLILTLVAAGWIAREFLLPDPILPSPLRSVTPEQAGLAWQECELPVLSQASNSPRPDESVACFGRPAPIVAGDVQDNSVQFIDKTHLRMTVGEDVYEARADDLMALTVYTLYKNGNRVKTLIGLGDTLWLRMFLSNVGGHIAWGIANENPATIIHDGKDLRNVCGLDKAHAAYGLHGKLIFVGEKDGKNFIVYDGQKVGPDYDRITIAYCCELALYSARGGQGRYQFRGTRGGKDYIVGIAAARLSAEATPNPEPTKTSTPAETSPTPTSTSAPIPAPSRTPGAPTSTPALAAMDLDTGTFPSPDGQWMARVTTALPIAGGVSVGENYYTRLEVARTDGTRVWTVVDAWSHFGLGYTTPRPFHWSKDGRYLYFTNVPVPDGCAVFVNGSDLQRMDLASGAVLEILPAGAWWISISPDENLVVSIRRGAQALQITRHDLRTAAEQSTELVVKGEGLQAGDVVWSPDGTAFMLTVAVRPCAGKWADATSMVRFDATSLTQRLLIDADKRLFTTVEWPTANRVLLRDGDHQRWWLDAATGQVEAASPPAPSPESQPFVPATATPRPSASALVPCPGTSDTDEACLPGGMVRLVGFVGTDTLTGNPILNRGTGKTPVLLNDSAGNPFTDLLREPNRLIVVDGTITSMAPPTIAVSASHRAAGAPGLETELPELYTNSQVGFAIQYPLAWIVEDDTAMSGGIVSIQNYYSADLPFPGLVDPALYKVEIVPIRPTQATTLAEMRGGMEGQVVREQSLTINNLSAVRLTVETELYGRTEILLVQLPDRVLLLQTWQDPALFDQMIETLRLADTPAVPAEPILTWKRELNGRCATVIIDGKGRAGFGPCSAPDRFSFILPEVERPKDLQHFLERYQPFESATPEGQIVFKGQGNQAASPAEQRAIADWAGLVEQELEYGRNGASWGMALAIVQESPNPCIGMQMQRSGQFAGRDCRIGLESDGWTCMTAEQLAQLYTWLDSFRAFEASFTEDDRRVRFVFSGQGLQDATPAEQQAIFDWAKAVYSGSEGK